MSDYLAQIKIKNGRIYRLMIEHGIQTQSELARLAQVSSTEIAYLINFKLTPLLKNGSWRASVLRIADVFGVLPDELFSPEQLTLQCESNRRDYLISHDDAMALADKRESFIGLPAPEAMDESMKGLIEKVINTLTPREKKVISKRFGLCGEDWHRYNEIAEELDVSLERIRQIESKALRKLRHPTRAYHLIVAQGEDCRKPEKVVEL